MKPKKQFKYIAIGLGISLIFLLVQMVITSKSTEFYLLFTFIKNIVPLIRSGSWEYESAMDVADEFTSLLLSKVMLISLVTDLIMLTILLFWAIAIKRKPGKEVGLEKMGRIWWVICPLLGFSLNLAVTGLLNTIPIPESLASTPLDYAFNSSNDYGIFFFAIVIMAPLTEEIVFRGLAYERFKRGTSMLGAAILSAVVFGVFHGSLIQGTYTAVLGMIQCFAFERCRSLWAPIMIHVGFNLCGFIFAWIPAAPSITIPLLIMTAGAALSAAMFILIFTKTEKPYAPGFMPSAIGYNIPYTESN